MNGRALVTAVMLLLAFGAAYSDALGIGYPTGLLLLMCAALVWFQWDAISEGFRSARDESNIPIIRLGSKIIGGIEFLRPGPPRHRSSPASNG